MRATAAAVFIFATALLHAETDTAETLYESDYAKGQHERRLWRDVKDSFLRHRFQAILKKQGLTLGCASCSSVFMDISFALSEQGVVQIRSIDRKKACGGEFPAAMEAAFLEFLRDYPYPTPPARCQGTA